MVSGMHGLDRSHCVPPVGERTPDRVGAVFAGEDGTPARNDVREHLERRHAARGGARPIGVEPGDRVAIYCRCAPRSPSPRTLRPHRRDPDALFSVSLHRRRPALQDSEAKVVITADYSLRRGHRLPMRENRRGGGQAGAVGRHVVPWERDSGWGAIRRGEPPASCRRSRWGRRASVPPHLHLGHDREPKGVVHVQGGLLVSITRERRLPGGRAHARDVLHSPRTGAGYGPWTVVGAGALGCHDRLRRVARPTVRPTGCGACV